jgi:hypothetical protein
MSVRDVRYSQRRRCLCQSSGLERRVDLHVGTAVPEAYGVTARQDQPSTRTCVGFPYIFVIGA